jgi:hypothetical protein
MPRVSAPGWQPKVDLDAGLRLTMGDYLDHYLAALVQGRR